MKKLALVLAVVVSGFVNAQYKDVPDTITKQQHLDAKKYAASDINIKSFESDLLALINDYRKSKGLSSLVVDSNLYKASTIQSDYMVSINQVTHKNSNIGFETPPQRIEYFYKHSYGVAGENACTGNLYDCALDNETPAEQIFRIWKSSPGHNHNMLNPNYTIIGLSLSRKPGFDYFYANFDAVDSEYESVITVTVIE